MHYFVKFFELLSNRRLVSALWISSRQLNIFFYYCQSCVIRQFCFQFCISDFNTYIYIPIQRHSSITAFSTESIQSFIGHFETSNLFPSSTLLVSPHLLLFSTLSHFVQDHLIHLFPSVNHRTLILSLLAGDVEMTPGLFTLNIIHLNIRSIRSFQKSSSLSTTILLIIPRKFSHSTKDGSSLQTLNIFFISGTSWLFTLSHFSFHWSCCWSCSHFWIIPEIRVFPLSQLFSTWIAANANIRKYAHPSRAFVFVPVAVETLDLICYVEDEFITEIGR